MKTRLEDDFYLYHNEEWLNTAVIPNDKPLTGSFIEIMDRNEKLLMKDLKEFITNKDVHDFYNDELFDRFLLVYKQAFDLEERKKYKNKYILEFVKKIEDVKNYKDLENLIIEFSLYNLTTPIPLGVMSDMKNANINALYFGMPNIILPEKKYYDKNNNEYQTGLVLLNKYQEILKRLLEKIGIDRINEIIENTIKFDNFLVPLAETAEEKADYIKSYNPYSYKDFISSTNKIGLDHILKSLINKEVNEVIVTNINYFNNLDKVLSLPLDVIKDWMISDLVFSFSNSGYGEDELRLISNEYALLLTGQKESLSFEKFTFKSLSREFMDVVGLYFGKRYFGEDAKKDVENMVYEFIDVYKNRLHNNNWLSKSTIKKAISKLSKIKPMIGYPNKIRNVYSNFVPSNNKTYVENLLELSKLSVLDNYNEYKETVDKELWLMGAFEVNAYYEPMNNQIVFPAGILQPPFYSYELPRGAKYGGIGAVIAHEITHAFDTNGARIDENGNINNWWEEKDFSEFNKKAEKMISLFDGVAVPNTDIKCNGKLTVTENISDAAGLSCAYEAGIKHNDFNKEDFFKNWVVIWRFKAHDAYMKLIANIDVHSPCYLRGMVQLMNFKPFKEFYHLKETDKMYLDDDKMVNIW